MRSGSKAQMTREKVEQPGPVSWIMKEKGRELEGLLKGKTGASHILI